MDKKLNNGRNDTMTKMAISKSSQKRKIIPKLLSVSRTATEYIEVVYSMYTECHKVYSDRKIHVLSV